MHSAAIMILEKKINPRLPDFVRMLDILASFYILTLSGTLEKCAEVAVDVNVVARLSTATYVGSGEVNTKNCMIASTA